MPTSQDLAIFVPTTTTDIQTDHFTPCACAWGNYAGTILRIIGDWKNWELELSRAHTYIVPHALHLHLSVRVAAPSYSTCICQRALPTYTRPVVHMSREHMACSEVGAVNRHGQQNALFVTFVGHAKQFEAYWSQFFSKFYGFVALTSRLDA